LQADPNNLEATIELARLNVITGRRPNHVRPLLERAQRIAPRRPESWKYSAIYNVNTFLQYETALSDIERYIELRPQDAFGHATRGFLLYRLGRHHDAVQSLETAIEIDSGHRYAYALTERVYWLLHRRAEGLQKILYRDKALAIQQHLADTPA
jgi:tetratricopeptide (TPR) repeat protein